MSDFNTHLAKFAGEPFHDPLFEIGRAFICELLDAFLDRIDQVLQEFNGMGDDQLDRIPALLEDVHDAVFELAQDFDDLVNLFSHLRDQALVLLLYSLEFLVGFVTCLFVTLRQFLGKGLLLLIYTLTQFIKADSNFIFGGFAYGLQVFVFEVLDIFADALLSLSNFILGFFQACIDFLEILIASMCISSLKIF